jgi:hypothetical protein
MGGNITPLTEGFTVGHPFAIVAVTIVGGISIPSLGRLGYIQKS